MSVVGGRSRESGKGTARPTSRTEGQRARNSEAIELDLPGAEAHELSAGSKQGHTISSSGMVIVRPDAKTLSRQCLPYFIGVSGSSAGATRISMNLVVVPPLSAADPHFHRGYESAVYLMKGRVDVRYGHALEQRLTLEQGDFLFIPADLPHQPVNLSPDEPALCIVSRNDPNEQESVEIFSEPGVAGIELFGDPLDTYGP